MGRNTAAVPVVEGVVEYFFPPVVVLEGHQCNFAGPEVVVLLEEMTRIREWVGHDIRQTMYIRKSAQQH